MINSHSLSPTACQTSDDRREENWGQIVQLAYAQLWLAQPLATVLPRPWERYLPPAVAAVRGACNLPLVLVTEAPVVMAAGLAKATGGAPLLCAATAANWEAMARLAKEAKSPLAVRADSVAGLAW